MYLCSLYYLLCMFSVSDSSIYMIYCRSFMLLVITCTCMLGPPHLIMYTCACYARHLALSYVLAGVANNPGPHVQILETGPWRPCCTWSVWRSGSVVWQLPIRTLFLPASPWSAREILIFLLVSTFPYFIVYILLLRFIVTLYSWDIISCLVIIVYWCYYCWIVCYHCASVLWFLHVLMLSVYTWGYFWPAYIRRSNVSVPTGAGRYT